MALFPGAYLARALGRAQARLVLFGLEVPAEAFAKAARERPVRERENLGLIELDELGQEVLEGGELGAQKNGVVLLDHVRDGLGALREAAMQERSSLEHLLEGGIAPEGRIENGLLRLLVGPEEPVKFAKAAYLILVGGRIEHAIHLVLKGSLIVREEFDCVHNPRIGFGRSLVQGIFLKSIGFLF